MFLTGLTFFIILSILVLIHELGHFLMAKKIGVKVEEFGMGLPPRIIGKKIKGTVYSINWLPIGGFVKLAGEDEEEPSVNSHSPRLSSGEAGQQTARLKADSRKLKAFFWARTKKERAAILLAGVTMNFLLAVGITSYLLTQGVHVPSGRVHVERVMPGSPAEIAGVMVQDRVVSITYYAGDGKAGETRIATPKELIDTTKAHIGEEITLAIDRNGTPISLRVVPRRESPKGEGPMGVAISDLELKNYPWYQIPFEAVKINLERAWAMLSSLGFTLWRLATLHSVAADVAGPIGIAQVTGQAVKFGFKAVLEFMSILSLNLAVLNVLPIPALDGGRLAFVFIEKIIGRKLRPAFERSTHQVGMLILFALIFLISINDILRIARGG